MRVKKQEETYELINEALLGSLIINRNTIISVNHFNDGLRKLYNKDRKNKISDYNFSMLKDTIKDSLKEEYKANIEKKINKRISFSILKADIPGTVDCIRIDIIGDM